MGARENLTADEKNGLVRRIYKYVKSMPGVSLKLSDLNGHRREITSEIGYFRGSLNQSEWATAWDSLVNMPDIFVISGTAHKTVLQYREPGQEYEDKRGVEKAAKQKIQMKVLDENERTECARFLCSLVSDKRISTDEARTSITEAMGYERIDGRSWKSILRLAKDPSLGNFIVEEAGYLIQAPTTEATQVPDTMPTKTRGTPEPIVLNGLTWLGDTPLEFTGNLLLEAEGPGGKITLQATHIKITRN